MMPATLIFPCRPWVRLGWCPWRRCPNHRLLFTFVSSPLSGHLRPGCALAAVLGRRELVACQRPAQKLALQLQMLHNPHRSLFYDRSEEQRLSPRLFRPKSLEPVVYVRSTSVILSQPQETAFRAETDSSNAKAD